MLTKKIVSIFSRFSRPQLNKYESIDAQNDSSQNYLKNDQPFTDKEQDFEAQMNTSYLFFILIYHFIVDRVRVANFALEYILNRFLSFIIHFKRVKSYQSLLIIYIFEIHIWVHLLRNPLLIFKHCIDIIFFIQTVFIIFIFIESFLTYESVRSMRVTFYILCYFLNRLSK